MTYLGGVPGARSGRKTVSGWLCHQKTCILLHNNNNNNNNYKNKNNRKLYVVGLINPSILKVKPNLIHHLFADRDGGYVRPCGNSALKNDPSGVVVG